jgi:hypothetical protein
MRIRRASSNGSYWWHGRTRWICPPRANQHPWWILVKRLLRHEDELVQFVLVDGLSADHNLTERSIRPLVVIREISGGSRSLEGTKTCIAWP